MIERARARACSLLDILILFYVVSVRRRTALIELSVSGGATREMALCLDVGASSNTYKEQMNWIEVKSEWGRARCLERYRWSYV